MTLIHLVCKAAGSKLPGACKAQHAKHGSGGRRANLKCSLLGCKVICSGIQRCNDAKPGQVCAVLPEGVACGNFWKF